MTPHQRLTADMRTPDEVRNRLQQSYAVLDPVVLLRDIRATQERLAALADVQPVAQAAGEQPIELFLASLRGVEGPAHSANGPTNRESKEGASSSSPLIQAAPHLRKWFEAEPWRNGSELLARLQTEYPGAYPDKLLRTLQRRLKSWRSEKASVLLFGSLEKAQEVADVAMPN